MKRKLVNVFRSINRKRILKLKNILSNNEKEKTIKYSLLIFGSIDLFRGFMHTFLVKYASEDISGIVKETYPIKEKNNIRTLMSGFGASNYQTGIIKILIASNNISKL